MESKLLKKALDYIPAGSRIIGLTVIPMEGQYAKDKMRIKYELDGKLYSTVISSMTTSTVTPINHSHTSEVSA